MENGDSKQSRCLAVTIWGKIAPTHDVSNASFQWSIEATTRRSKHEYKILVAWLNYKEPILGGRDIPAIF